jgi:hypothetical protein
MQFIQKSNKNNSYKCPLTKSSQKTLVRSYPFIVFSENTRFSTEIAKILGTTKRISAPNSESFADQIGKYIDSKDQKRGKKDKKKEGKVSTEKKEPRKEKKESKEKKEPGKSKKESKKKKEPKKKESKEKKESKKEKKESKEKNESEQKNESKKEDPPALWPLIRQVRVWCSSSALSTGAILVDLPGIADANMARNNIAKAYMKKVKLAIHEDNVKY